ncbi:MAG: hypothetical protein N0E56_21590, partial [Candidatus Thiodiazotropha endolucinida]|nr:hypothetical protein [Candidatus Thiodiazotropha taylori]MCW4269208.1 hypothetical protein [Candidatus Thiodiazotropha endolucinida]
ISCWLLIRQDQSTGYTASSISPYTRNQHSSGDVNSTLSNNLGFGGHQSPEEGADTPVWLANGGAGAETTGRYFENRRKVSCGFSKDRNTMERLFKACEAYG